MAPTYKLKYFNGRGRGEPIRLIFAYAKVPYEDVRVPREDWPKVKETTTWGQMPLLEVDGVEIAQTKAIGRFVANKHGLAGESDLDKAKCDEYLDVQDDILQEMGKWFRESDAGKKAELAKTIVEDVFPKYFAKFEVIIKKNGNGVLVGKKVTYADIFLANLVSGLGSHFPDFELSKFPEMKKHMEMVLALPGIKERVATRPETPF